jgi:hypothetical protein
MIRHYRAATAISDYDYVQCTINGEPHNMRFDSACALAQLLSDHTGKIVSVIVADRVTASAFPSGK